MAQEKPTQHGNSFFVGGLHDENRRGGGARCRGGTRVELLLRLRPSTSPLYSDHMPRQNRVRAGGAFTQLPAAVCCELLSDTGSCCLMLRAAV